MERGERGGGVCGSSNGFIGGEREREKSRLCQRIDLKCVLTKGLCNIAIRKTEARSQSFQDFDGKLFMSTNCYD